MLPAARVRKLLVHLEVYILRCCRRSLHPVAVSGLHRACALLEKRMHALECNLQATMRGHPSLHVQLRVLSRATQEWPDEASGMRKSKDCARAVALGPQTSEAPGDSHAAR